MNEHNFTLLSVPLPPMLSKMVGVVGNSRYFSIAYWGSKATWFAPTLIVATSTWAFSEMQDIK